MCGPLKHGSIKCRLWPPGLGPAVPPLNPPLRNKDKIVEDTYLIQLLLWEYFSHFIGYI